MKQPNNISLRNMILSLGGISTKELQPMGTYNDGITEGRLNAVGDYQDTLNESVRRNDPFLFRKNGRTIDELVNDGDLNEYLGIEDKIWDNRESAKCYITRTDKLIELLKTGRYKNKIAESNYKNEEEYNNALNWGQAEHEISILNEQVKILKNKINNNGIQIKPVPIHEAIESFIDWLFSERNLSFKTAVVYRGILFKLVECLGSNQTLVGSINLDELRRFIRWYKQQAAISPARLNTIVATLRSFWDYCVISEFCAVDVAAGLYMPKPIKRAPRSIPPEEMDRLIATLNLRDLAMVSILQYTGIRVGELVTLKVNDIDLSRHELRVYGKGSKERTIAINSKLQAVLNTYLTDLTARIKAGLTWLFPTPKGAGHLTARMVQLRFKQLALSLGIERLNPHLFRSTFATSLYRNGTDVFQIQQMMGHETLQQTREYTAVPNDADREAVEQL